MTLKKGLHSTPFVLASLTVAAAQWASASSPLPVIKFRTGELTLPAYSTKHRVPARASTFIVQLTQAPTLDVIPLLRDLGFEVLRYLPDHAWIIRRNSDQASLDALTSLPYFYTVTQIPSETKVSPEVLMKKGALGKNTQAPGQWAISLFSNSDLGATLKQVKSILGKSGAILDATAQALWVSASMDRLHALAELDSIEWIQEMPRFETMDFKLADKKPRPTRPARGVTGYETGTKVMGSETIWADGFFGEGQVAAMADTGLDTGDQTTLSQDFAGFKKGLPFGIFSSTWKDPQGHGTHVAGSVLGNGKASGNQFPGMAPKGALVAESLWSEMAGGLAFGSNLLPLLKSAYDSGARVHTNSWGNPNALGVYDNFAAQADDFLWNNPDFLILFAAGNSGIDANSDGLVDSGSVSSPGTAKNVLTVGASENYVLSGGLQKKYGEMKGGKLFPAEPLFSDWVSDKPAGLAAFSSRGPTKDSRTKPEIVAPGTNILSVRSHVQGTDVLWGEYDQNYVWSGGTSMATPLTAGAALLAREFLVKAQNISNPSGSLVKGLLLHTAFDLYPGQYPVGPTQEISKTRPNNQEGYGRVDLAALIAMKKDLSVVDERIGVGQGETLTYNIPAKAGQKVRATLIYMDAPASPSAQKTLINDLDLSVQLPDQSIRELKDRVNNNEMIEFLAPADGSYVVRVSGVSIPQGKNGKLPFSLVLSASNAQEN